MFGHTIKAIEDDLKNDASILDVRSFRDDKHEGEGVVVSFCEESSVPFISEELRKDVIIHFKRLSGMEVLKEIIYYVYDFSAQTKEGVPDGVKKMREIIEKNSNTDDDDVFNKLRMIANLYEDKKDMWYLFFGVNSVLNKQVRALYAIFKESPKLENLSVEGSLCYKSLRDCWSADKKSSEAINRLQKF